MIWAESTWVVEGQENDQEGYRDLARRVTPSNVGAELGIERQWDRWPWGESAVSLPYSSLPNNESSDSYMHVCFLKRKNSVERVVT